MFADFNWAETVSSPVFIALIACSVVTLAVAAERAYYFWTRRGNVDVLGRKVARLVRNGDLAGAERECRESKHPFGSVAERLFEKGKRDLESIEERLHIALSQQKLLLEKNLGVLGTMAAVAPLLGLLGTVWGIMRAFHEMARVGSAAPSVVAAGVSEALVTTAAGLVVAVPALMLHNHFARRLNVMLTMSENHARLVRTEMPESATPERAHETVPKRPAPEAVEVGGGVL